MVIKRIKDPTIAGLILGKYSRAKELGICMKLDERTVLQSKHKNISSSILVGIIGKLIENAMESVSRNDKEEKTVNVRIEETDKLILIEVEDSGIGIAQNNLEKIFERGFTTKPESVEGFDVRGITSNGDEALGFCKKTEVDLIILDIYMLKTDGISFLKELRKRFMMIDVILVTASRECQNINAVLKLGAVDYLMKPFEYGDIGRPSHLYKYFETTVNT